MPVGEHACIICGAERGGVPVIPSVKSGGAQDWAAKLLTEGGMRRSGRRITALGVMLIFLFLICGSGVFAYEYFTHQNMIEQYTAEEAVLFRTGGTLQINIPGLGGASVITNNYSAGAAVRQMPPLKADSSGDSRFIAYLNNRVITGKRDYKGDLYLLDLVLLNESGEENEGILLREDVVDFWFLPRGDSILYLTQDGDVYICDYSLLKNPLLVVGVRTREILIDSGVSGIGAVDDRYLLYYKGASANTFTWRDNMETETGRPFDLYIINIEDEDRSPVLVDTRVYRVEDTMRELERIVFTKRTHIAPLVSYDVFVFHRREGLSIQIARGARHVVDASAAMAAVLCLSPSEEELRFRDLFDDDMLDYDQDLEQPQWSDYAPGEDVDIYELDPAVLDEIENRWSMDWQLYEEKLARDHLRRSLRANIRDFLQDNYLSFGLFYTDGESTVKLADQIYNRGDDITALAWGSVERGIALYVRGEREGIRRIPMSELDYDQVVELEYEGLDIMRHLTAGMPDILWYHGAGEEPIEVFAESGARQISRFLMVGEGIYFSVLWEYLSESGTLYYTSVSGEGMGSVVYLDENVTDYTGLSGAGRTSLVYRKVMRGEPGSRDISLAAWGSARVIAQGTDPHEDVLILGENADIFAYYRAPEAQNVRELYINGRQERFIAQSIVRLGLYNEDFIYLMREYAADTSLYLYRMGEFEVVSENVDDAVFFGLPG
ncbi:MAG: hypothetical protein FWH00_04065 [Oscillospiraceae bacterium]|nr:hypothetical protein [Oscillospiraceae bacterium]